VPNIFLTKGDNCYFVSEDRNKEKQNIKIVETGRERERERERERPKITVKLALNHNRKLYAIPMGSYNLHG
jgi:hypothetical protein